MPSRRVAMRSSMTNQITHFGIMGGLYNRKISGRSSMNRVTSRLEIPASAKEGYQYMKMHNLLSRNPLGSGGVGKMFRLRAGGSSLGNHLGSVKKTTESLGDSLGEQQEPSLSPAGEGEYCQQQRWPAGDGCYGSGGACKQTHTCNPGASCSMIDDYDSGGAIGGGICTRNICVDGSGDAGATAQNKKSKLQSGNCGSPCKSVKDCSAGQSCQSTIYGYSPDGACNKGSFGGCCEDGAPNMTWHCDPEQKTCWVGQIVNTTAAAATQLQCEAICSPPQPCGLLGSSVCTVDVSGDGCYIPSNPSIQLEENTICCKNTPATWDPSHGCIDRGVPSPGTPTAPALSSSNLCHTAAGRWWEVPCFNGETGARRTCPVFGSHTVKSGDTCSSIANALCGGSYFPTDSTMICSATSVCPKPRVATTIKYDCSKTANYC